VAVAHAHTQPFLPGEPGLAGLQLRKEDVVGAGKVDGQPFVALNIDAILGRVLA
jgi:hypothetical protein